MHVQFFDRSHLPAAFCLDWVEVQELTWSLPGGSDQAQIVITGSLRELQAMGERLRYGVEIRDETGAVCWCGFINSLALLYPGSTVTASLNDLYNSVAVWHTPSDPGSAGSGRVALTAPASDSESQTLWGVKELRQHAGFYSGVQAAALRDNLLAKHRYPRANTALRPKEPGNAALYPRGLLECRGWYHSLDWKYYAQPAGTEGYIAEGVGVAPVGNTASSAQAAQSFSLASPAGWEADQVYIKVKKVGAPADNLLVELCADAAGAPGAVLQSVAAPGASIPLAYRFYPFVFPARQSLAAATLYWVKVSRSGALDPNNFYVLQVNDSLGYTRGVFRLWNGGAWSARAPDTDLNFEVQGSRETTRQIEEIAAAAACGQFIASVRIDAPSGIYQSFYRSGETRGKAEIDALLAAGTSAGAELLARVDAQRCLSVWQAPAYTASPTLLLGEDGRLYRHGKIPVQPAEDWLGQWMDFDALLKPTGMLAAAGPVFIRSGSWTPSRGLQVSWTAG
jgi:hypothetical protein